MKRTGSIGSRVPPAVTITRRAGEVGGGAAAPERGWPVAASTMAAGSARRPAPTSPPARRPTSGSTTCTPRARSTRRLSCTAGCSHISVCIAGHTSTGARVASSDVGEQVVADARRRRGRAPGRWPGATSTRSAVWPRWVCGIGCVLVPERRPGPLGAERVEGGAPDEVQRALGEHRDHVGARRRRGGGRPRSPCRRRCPPDTPRTTRLPSSMVVGGAGARRPTRRPRRRRRPPRRPPRGPARRRGSCRPRSPRRRSRAACGPTR